MLKIALLSLIGALQPGADSASCAPSQGLGFICGMQRPEDLARIPETRWLVVSGFSEGAGLKLVDTESKRMRLWYTGAREQLEPDKKTYPACATAPDAKLFNTQGISLRSHSGSRHTLYVVNHGSRESIEVFSIDSRGDEPTLKWKGCALLPEGHAANSVASFSDGVILASVLTRPGTTITDFVQGKTTGGVYEWKPGEKSFRLLPGTELPGNNGLETSPDDKAFYVVAFGWRSVVSFSRGNTEQSKRKAIAPGFMPDNIHWDQGRLITAGMQYDEPACGGLRRIVNGQADGMLCHRGYVVAALDPESLEFSVLAYSPPNPSFNGVSAALFVDQELWLASYQSDRIAYSHSGEVIEVDSGKISGKILPSAVRAYRGVPFAAPPVRELRWREPQAVAPWEDVYHADRPAPECIQTLRAHDINHYFGEEATSEDCLYLNIWAPPDARTGARKPVVVWIYGGGFTIGSANMANYSGEPLARKGVVYVSIAYRVGALGFLAHPALAAESPHHVSGNYGLLDQIAGLQWVKRNIAKFGGDPDNVTILGQSAGSMSVSILQASPLACGLFARAVGMSGGMFGGGVGNAQTLAAAEANGVRFQEQLKAGDLRALRDLPADRILQAQLAAPTRWGPALDGYLLPQSPQDLFAAGKQSDVPLLIGFTHDESFSELARAQTLAEYQQIAAKLYGESAPELLKRYPAKTDPEARRAAIAAARDSTVALQMRSWARAQVKNGKAPVYVYLFSRVHPYAPGITFSDHDPKTVGAYHTGDLPYWLGTLDSLNLLRKTRDWTDFDRQLSESMSDAIVKFARSGDPGWPQYRADREQLREWGDTSQVISWPNRKQMEFFVTQTAAAEPARPRTRD